MLTAPRMAAVAGIVFAVLFAIVLVLLHGTLEHDFASGAPLSDERRTRLTIAMKLMPFAGIAFLWFIAVIRDGLGRAEDRFYATVFLASGIVFLTMMFVATAIAAGLVTGTAHGDPHLPPGVVSFGAAAAATASKTFALRMAAVFMISLATIWWKTRLMPKWLALVTYAGALTLLVIGDLSQWVTLSFPTWVLVVSLVMVSRAGRTDPGLRPAG
ncbi:hypothetical protein [Gordonia crocea]|nr:hypothetical protein [Gordonia crocea]